MSKKDTIVLVAGGTGGHLFPAQALAEELKAEGFNVVLFTDKRAQRFVNNSSFDSIYSLSAATITSKNPVKLTKTLMSLAKGFYQADRLLAKYKPKLVIGFGGYPTLSPLFSAILRFIPTMIHEQNSVMGRANRLLSKWVTAIALGFKLDDNKYEAKTLVTGIPLRAEVLKELPATYAPPKENEKFNLLIFGGSQGASFFSDIFPAAFKGLSQPECKKFFVTQQVKTANEYEKLEKFYKNLDIECELSSFFTDLPQRMKKAHFVISRAGASTVTELSAMGRPALLVPYPHALDHDQSLNAKYLIEDGGVQVIEEKNLTAQKLSQLLHELLTKPDELARKAELVRQKTPADLNQNLVKLVKSLAAGKTIDNIKKEVN